MIEKYLEYLEFERNYSKHTIKNYSIDLKSFESFVNQSIIDDKSKDISNKIIRNYIVYLSNNSYRETSINRKLSAVKSYMNFIKEINGTQESNTARIKKPKIPKKIHTVISEIELKNLLENDQIFSNKFNDIRNKLIIEIFYSTGFRKSELIELKISNINFYNNTIKVLGKRNKERIIPISDLLKNNIKNYLVVRNEKIKTDNLNLFVTSKGKSLDEKSIYNIVKNNLSKVSLKQKKNPHILRHTFATHLLNNGADITAIKELLGHSSLASTQIYTSSSIDNLKKIYNQAHPRGLKNL